MEKWIGTLIRRERLRQNLSQEGLCRGICVVSYLSKIEQGKVEATEDILLPLLARLGIAYKTTPDFLRESSERIETIYEALFAGRRAGAEFAEAMQWLEREEAQLLCSPYMLDAMLLLALCRGQARPELSDFTAAMDHRQYGLYLLLREQAGEHTAEDLLRLQPCAYYACALGGAAYCRGEYPRAIRLLLRAYDLAAEEGSPHLMCEAQLLLGNCYSASGQPELMLESYRSARSLAKTLGNRDWVTVIDYNTGSSYLEWGMVEEAYRHLYGLDYSSALYYHKLALTLEALGRPEEALSVLAQGRAAEQDASDLTRQMLALPEYRLTHPDYLDEPAYAELLETLFSRLRREMPSGFVRFHLPYMLTLWEHQRRYKDAYRLVLEFSDLSRKVSL